MAVSEVQHGRNKRALTDLSRRGDGHRSRRSGLRRTSTLVRQASGRARKTAPGLSGGMPGRNYIALRPNTGLEHYRVLRISGANQQPEAPLHNAGIQPVFNHDGHLHHYGHETPRMGTRHANARMVRLHGTAQRAGSNGTPRHELPSGHRLQSAPRNHGRALAGTLMDQLCSNAHSRRTGAPDNRAISSDYFGRGACFVPSPGAGTRSGKGIGFLSSCTGFLIAGDLTAMMEGGGAAGNSSSPRRTQQECSLFLVMFGKVSIICPLDFFQHLSKYTGDFLFPRCLMIGMKHGGPHYTRIISGSQRRSGLKQGCVNNVIMFLRHYLLLVWISAGMTLSAPGKIVNPLPLCFFEPLP